MEAAKLKNFVQVLCQRLTPRFETILDPEERIRLVLSQPETNAELANLMLDVAAVDELEGIGKDPGLAKQNREDGNSAFQSGNVELSVLLYSEAMRYSPVHPATHEGEEMAAAAANRSAAHFQLKRFRKCLDDIELSVESGYPSNALYKLYIRKCRCLLEMERISEAQSAFDQAVDAIDRSGLRREVRKDLAAELQEAFISLVKSAEDECVSSKLEEEEDSLATLPEYLTLKDPNPKYPSASSGVTVKYDPAFGRHVVATRDIEAGEVLFCEEPIVSLLCPAEEATTEACHRCFRYIGDSAVYPCPTCVAVVFCSLRCRKEALGTNHAFECRMAPVLNRTALDRHSLILMAIRSVVQKPATFFVENRERFRTPDTKNGVAGDIDGGVYLSDDYSNLFNLVSHSDRRVPADTVSKTIFVGFLLRCMRTADYLKDVPEEQDAVVGRALLQFLECLQFNTHMVESVYSNRLVASDSETRIWKDADKFVHGEFVEMSRLGAAVYPTLANINHSCDPNVILVNWNKLAVAVANRPIKAGEQVFDTYGPGYDHMDREERRSFLKGSHWFECTCRACSGNWPAFDRIPRDYLKLPGSNFRFHRCNRKELQRDVERTRARIKDSVAKGDLSSARETYFQWISLLDELLVPPHQDFVNVRRGLRTCLWLSTPNVVKVREDEALRAKKEAAAAARSKKGGGRR